MIRMLKDDVIAAIMTNNLPTIFIDTCSVLDFFRISIRGRSSSDYYTLQKILPLVGNRLNIVICDSNIIEYGRNKGQVKTELERYILKSVSNMVNLENLAHFCACGFELSFKALETLNLSEKLDVYVNAIFDDMIVILEDQASVVNGNQRAIQRIAPAENGKSADSNFYCHFLSVWEGLRNGGFQGKMVFLTSNTQDFGKVREPVQPIKSELTRFNVTYCDNWSWAMNEILPNAATSLALPGLAVP